MVLKVRNVISKMGITTYKLFQTLTNIFYQDHCEF